MDGCCQCQMTLVILMHVVHKFSSLSIVISFIFELKSLDVITIENFLCVEYLPTSRKNRGDIKFQAERPS